MWPMGPILISSIVAFGVRHHYRDVQLSPLCTTLRQTHGHVFHTICIKVLLHFCIMLSNL